MGTVDHGFEPSQAMFRQVEIGKKRRRRGHRVHRRAVVMHQTGQDHFDAAGTTTNGVVRLEDGDVEPRLGKTNSRGQPIGPTADNDGCAHFESTGVVTTPAYVALLV